MKKLFLWFPALFCLALAVPAQDFGFGDFEESAFSGGPVKIGGQVSAGLKGFFGDFSSPEKMGNMDLGDIFSGRLDFSVSGAAAEGIINLEISPPRSGASPSEILEIDEAYIRAFFGPLNVEGGLRKLSWGKADSFGPLDVINPLDYSDLSELTDPESVKLARPMIHVTWNTSSFSKLEAVFVPWFRGHKFSTSGRWAPEQISRLQSFPSFDIDTYYKDHKYTLEYAQAGLRFSGSAGSSDFGFQYYFGRLPRPAVAIDITKLTPPPASFDGLFNIGYNYYHQIGADFARVIWGFNTRAEAGVNITSDTGGSDGAVYNPSIVWSLGFDRDLFLAINLNLQGTGSVRLFHDKLGSSLADTEAGKDRTSTRITAKLSRKFFQDELELKTTGLWGIEDRDFLIMPALVWSRNDLSAELSAGFFGGDKDGELGQYDGNNFIKTILSYKF
jgi:hypothetical protein